MATAIVRRLNPQCSFVLLDKLEQMDLDTLREFGAWLESEGLQAIATRVSTGPECTLIIEDGMAVQPSALSKSGAHMAERECFECRSHEVTSHRDRRSFCTAQRA